MTETLPPRKRRPFGKLALGVGVVVALWTGGWFYIKGEVIRRMDIELGKLDGRGLIVACPDRTVSGWPFRIVVACQSPSLVGVGDLAADAAAIRVTGLVYRPNHVIVEVGAPFNFKRGDLRVAANWGDLRASVSLNNGQLGLFSLVANDFVGRISPTEGLDQELRFVHGEAHVTPDPAAPVGEGRPPAAYLANLQLRQASSVVNGKAQVPVPVDATLDALLDRVPPSGLARARALAEAGTRLTVRRLDIGLGDISLNASGAFAVGPDGRIDGRLEMQSVATPDGAAQAKAPSPIKAALAGMFLFMSASGKSETGRDGPRLDFVVEQGRMRFGKMALGTLRPLF